MLELFKYERVKFNKKGEQKQFLLKTKELLGMTDLKLAQKLKVSKRTLSDWKREKFSISKIDAQKLAKLANISLPKDHSIVDLNNHLKSIGQKGGRKRIILYGKIALDEEYRNKKWREWWQDVGQYKKKPKKFNTIIKIRIPSKNEKLAEFVGIMLGDGGIAPYHIHITLSNKEKEYCKYIVKLIYELFEVNPKIYKIKKAKAIDIVVQRKNLVNFCQQIGLVQGSKIKNQIDIPEWIKENKIFLKACIRGLVDTDGCFYINSYNVNNKRYSYFKIAFTNSSFPLIKSVFTTFGSLGFHSRISKNKKDVRIDKEKYVNEYIKEIGSSNKKNLDKIEQWKNNHNMVK